MSGYLDAKEASRQLGISRQTLYAYVSRGLISAREDPGRRRSLYPRADIERLLARQARGRRPRQAAQAALNWGFPVMPSGLTLIENGEVYYRGQSAMALAQTASLEAVACLLWSCDEISAFGSPAPDMPAGWRQACRRLERHPPAQRLLALFSQWQSDLQGYLAPGTQGFVHRTCASLLRLMTAAATGNPATSLPVHRQLAKAWRLSQASADQLRAALVLCADHELNASSFTARCVASTGADPGATVIGGLAALSGPLHGGMTAQVEALLDQLQGKRRLTEELRGRLTRETWLPGFGHRLYPAGDPRASAIINRLALPAPTRRLIDTVYRMTGLAPSLDLALVLMRRELGLPAGSAFSIFAIGRTVGWLAHALEQREQRQLIRPRAAYTGPAPDTHQAPGRQIKLSGAPNPVPRG